MKRTDLRNIAIIAHVDHGKTTLVDQMLRQSGLFRESELRGECILDSNPLERERGITILAKNIAITLPVGTSGSLVPQATSGSLVPQATSGPLVATDRATSGPLVATDRIKINLIDTPGHADFGGEVERVLKMADGALLLVDAAEGPLPQTRFVLRKAFACGLRPIVVINKIDRPDARPNAVLNEVFDLFVELDADDATLDFPIIYASGRQGIAKRELSDVSADIRPLYEIILSHVPAPEVDVEAPLQLLVTNLDYSDYVGRIAVGRVFAGRILKNQRIALIGRDNQRRDETVKQLFVFDRLGRTEANEVSAGDICAVVGLGEVEIGDTIADVEHAIALPPIRVDEPTLDMVFRINDSPFSGQEGSYVTSRQLRDRLMKELERNVALRVEPDELRRDEFHVSGRGLLHLGILLENMRREGFELSVGKPRVINREINGEKMKPIEYLVIEVPPGSVGPVMEIVGNRRAECLKMDARGDMTHLEFTIPARGLIGLRTRLLNATNGKAIINHNFYEYQPLRGPIPARVNGVMISTEIGMATGHAIENLQERGSLFVGPTEQVYEGQIVGEHCRDNDLPVNICREKKLTNVRASTAEKTVVLKPPRRMELEAALEYIEEDELVEVTPKSIRLRKMFLKESDRKKHARAKASAEQ